MNRAARGTQGGQRNQSGGMLGGGIPRIPKSNVMGVADSGFDPESLMKDVDLTMIKESSIPGEAGKDWDADAISASANDQILDDKIQALPDDPNLPLKKAKTILKIDKSKI